MNDVVWTCWFQGRDNAPQLVQRCLQSWEERNPGWQVRVLDRFTLSHYIDLPSFAGKTITYTSLSDVIRVLLLAEFGGVWTDATVFCNRALDDWLPKHLSEGFFAFDKPGPDRRLSSWFLASETGNYVVDRWCHSTLKYWSQRNYTHHYFWFHELFGELCESDPEFQECWAAVPKISAEGPHVLQRNGMFRTDIATAEEELDPEIPMHKLSHKFEREKYEPGTLVWHLLESAPERGRRSHGESPPRRARAVSEWLPSLARSLRRKWQSRWGDSRLRRMLFARRPANIHNRVSLSRATGARDWVFASLKVSTNNLGDHIQIIAGKRLLGRFGIEPSVHIDRDDDIATCKAVPGMGRIALLVNGWFKTNRRQWPPNERIAPIFLGFHIRLFQCPELMSEQAVHYYKNHEPIGCRDPYTHKLLGNAGVASCESHCLSMIFPRRLDSFADRSTVFVVSRDERVLDILPHRLGPLTYINHYSETFDYEANEERARILLDRYRSDARLFVTTFLHCALPAIAMGIPVVVFYPANHESGHASDRERFSALEQIVPIYSFEDVDQVDWNPKPVDVSHLKLRIIDQFESLASRWPLPERCPIGPIAPSSVLPTPGLAARGESQP